MEDFRELRIDHRPVNQVVDDAADPGLAMESGQQPRPRQGAGAKKVTADLRPAPMAAVKN